MRRGGSLEKTLIWEDWGQKEKGMRRLNSITNSVDMDLSKLQDIVEKRAAGMLQSMGFRRVGHNLVTEQSKWVLHWIPAFLLNSRVEGGLGEMVVKCKNSPVIYLNFFTENFLQGKEAWMSLFQSHRGGILQNSVRRMSIFHWGWCRRFISLWDGGAYRCSEEREAEGNVVCIYKAGFCIHACWGFSVVLLVNKSLQCQRHKTLSSCLWDNVIIKS